jgi:tetratricopeptide (TPR) repeat protein
MLFNDHRLDDALGWARRAVAAQPLYASGQRALGKVALALGRNAEALAAFEQALALEPANAANRYNLELARRAVAGDR